ncbi:MAG TPA: P1 family peptidase, partial [Chloroflexota bacterium]|nr:P1 family peptidase [Chloroflexota bacterium]
RVGHTTLISGEGPLQVGRGRVRTGVTAIHPHEGSVFSASLPAAIEVLNGTGEITGRSHVDELGLLESPILITNTLSVGEVHRACVDWLCRQEPSIGTRHFVVPVVAETFDGSLNDAAGQHVSRDHVFAALDSASAGPVAEGNVGGGTGMRLFGFKGGIGTASRMVLAGDQTYALGVLVQGNFGAREDLLVDGVPVGRELRHWSGTPAPSTEMGPSSVQRDGSIIVVIATNAPLNERQLRRLCRRGVLGLGRVGSTAGNTSGDLLIAFSNAPENRVDRCDESNQRRIAFLADGTLNPLFRATVEATAEAVLNALCAAETMTGRDDNVAHALPLDEVCAIMRRHGRLS